MGIENFSKTDCSELKMLIHPGLVQVNEATKIRKQLSLSLPLITIFSAISQLFSCILSQTTDNSPGKKLLQIESARRVFLLVDYYNSCSDLKSTGDQCGWKPLLLPHVLFGQQENICLLLQLATVQSPVWL